MDRLNMIKQLMDGIDELSDDECREMTYGYFLEMFESLSDHELADTIKSRQEMFLLNWEGSSDMWLQ
jgi:hypothetical protein